MYIGNLTIGSPNVFLPEPAPNRIVDPMSRLSGVRPVSQIRREALPRIYDSAALLLHRSRFDRYFSRLAAALHLLSGSLDVVELNLEQLPLTADRLERSFPNCFKFA